LKIYVIHIGVSNKTLQRWANDGKIRSIRTDGNHRRYKIDLENAKKKIIYARVSSKKQKDDLDRQIQFMQEKYKGYTVAKDIESGINFKRKGFNHITVFRNKLKYLCSTIKGRRYIECTEEYTSKVCGKCGSTNKNLGSQKVYQCTRCDVEFDRDINGARNILIKFLTGLHI